MFRSRGSTRNPRRVVTRSLLTCGTAAVLSLSALGPAGRCLAAAAPPRAVTPGDGPAELARAQKLIQSGSFDQAITLLRRRVTRHPDDAEARLLLGTALALLPRRAEALDELTRAVRLRPDFAPGYHALGMAYLRFVELEQARQAFGRAIELDPRFAPAHVNLALVLAQTGELDGALAHVHTAIEIEGLSPAAAYAHHLGGLLLSQQDQPREAEKAFETALALQPDRPDSLLQLGLARRRLLDFDGSLAALRAAVRLAPADARVQYELGKELLRAGRSDEAILHLRIAVGSRPEDTTALYNLARALRTSGRAKEAKEVVKRINELRGRSEEAQQHAFKASALNNEGVELEKSGKLGAAIERYASALELDPLNTVFRRNLALALCRTGRWREGIVELQEVLRLDPADAEATKALYMALDMAERKP